MRCTLLSVMALMGAAASLLPTTAVRAANCTVTATAVTFGNYNPLAANPRNRNGRITVACNGKGAFTLALSTGQSGSYTARYMTSGSGDRLDYNLYTSARRTGIFGDGTGGTRTVSRRFKNNTRRVTVYGRIPAMENVSAGDYTDSITLTVSF